MLTNLFTSQTRVDILKLFLLHPEERYYGRQIAILIKKNTHGVFREIENLEKIGLLEREYDGNRAYFRVKKRCPFFRELRGIFLKAEGIADYIQKQRL